MGTPFVGFDTSTMRPQAMGCLRPQEGLSMDAVVVVGAQGAICRVPALCQAGVNDVLRFVEPPVCCSHHMSLCQELNSLWIRQPHLRIRALQTAMKSHRTTYHQEMHPPQSCELCIGTRVLHGATAQAACAANSQFHFQHALPGWHE